MYMQLTPPPPRSLRMRNTPEVMLCSAAKNVYASFVVDIVVGCGVVGD